MEPKQKFTSPIKYYTEYYTLYTLPIMYMRFMYMWFVLFLLFRPSRNLTQLHFLILIAATNLIVIIK